MGREALGPRFDGTNPIGNSHPKKGEGLRQTRSKPQFWLVSLLLASTVMVAVSAIAQGPQERTLDEIKTEAIHRAENGMYPLIGLDASDLREAFASIHTSDKDEWASAFMAVADRYMNEAKSLEKSDPAKANADYVRAW